MRTSNRAGLLEMTVRNLPDLKTEGDSSMKTKLAKTITVGAVAGMAMIGTSTPASASPLWGASTQSAVATSGAPEMTYYELNESQMGLGSNDFTFDVSGSGVATATSNVNGESEVLPKETTDADGQTVVLKYEETEAGELIVSAVDADNSISTATANGVAAADFNAGQCALGTVGGAGAGGLAGGLGGAAVGTVTLPVVGTVGAGAVGLVGGGIFGGMTGAAASCFG
jgi:hypothetical protein